MSHSTKEVVHYSMHGLEVVQPGLETVFYPEYQNYSNPAQADKGQHSQERRVFGMRKVTFWLISALAALSIIAVGVPVGLGVGLSKSQGGKRTESKPNGDGIPSSQSAEVTTVVMTTTAAGTTPATSPNSSPSGGSTSSKTTSAPSTSPTIISACPKGNRTVSTPALGTVQYMILCDRDFDGAKEDLASVVMPSFDDCLNLCNTMNYFQKRTDVGCTYNVAGTGTQTPGTCWCLGGEAKIVVTNVGNQIAVPL